MNTEETEFAGWTYDRQVEAAYTPLKIVKACKLLFWGGFWGLCAVGLLKAATNFSPPHGYLHSEAGDCMVEVRKQWFCCQACKRYLLLDGRSEERFLSVVECEAHYASFAEARKLIIGQQAARKR